MVHHEASIKVVSFERWQPADELELKQHMGIRLAHLPPQDFTIDKSALLDSSLVIFQGAEVETKVGRFYHQKLPKTVRVLDLEESFGLSSSRKRAFEAGTDPKSTVADPNDPHFASELASAYKSDLVLCQSDYEKMLLHLDYSVGNCVLLPQCVDSADICRTEVEEQQFYSRACQRMNLLFFGDFSLESDSVNLKYALEEVWPQISERLPNMYLDVMGHHLNSNILSLCGNTRNVRVVVRANKV